MLNFEKPFIQVAGIKSRQEAEALIELGVEYIGIPLRLGFHAPDIDEPTARDIVANIKNRANPVLICYLSRAEEIMELREYLSVGIVQLHGDIRIEEVERLRKYEPELKIIKSIIIGNRSAKELIAEAYYFAPFTDAFLTDTYDFETGARGATGKTHDWNLSRQIVERSPLPVILAGGLSPDNVADAIKLVKPAGADVHTCVEDSFGDKDAAKVRLFLENAYSAFEKLDRFNK